MKKVLSVVLALMVAGMVFAGGNKEGASAGGKKKDVVVVFIPKIT